MLTFYESKYDKRNSFHVLKSLTYFDEVDLNDWPDMITQKNLSWEKIMNVINIKCKDYTSALINKGN